MDTSESVPPPKKGESEVVKEETGKVRKTSEDIEEKGEKSKPQLPSASALLGDDDSLVASSMAATSDLDDEESSEPAPANTPQNHWDPGHPLSLKF